MTDSITVKITNVLSAAGERTNQGKNNGEKQETMNETKYHSEHKHLEIIYHILLHMTYDIVKQSPMFLNKFYQLNQVFVLSTLQSYYKVDLFGGLQ